MRDVVRFVFNGSIREVQGCDPTLTLLEWLRTNAKLMGTKEGCAEGDCGSCTVLVGTLTANATDSAKNSIQWRAVNACILFVPMLDGKALMTIESLGCSGDRSASLHPAQQAMIDLHGSQCGFCTPGFIMSMVGKSIGACGTVGASDEDILAGNLCRCTGYGPILAAARSIVPDRFDASETAALLRQIQGDPVMRIRYRDRLAEGRERSWYSPRTVEQLLELLSLSPEARIVAGATDVGLWVTKQHRVLNDCVYLGGIEELNAIETNANGITIKAGVRYTDAHQVLHDLHSDLGLLVRRVGAVQVRNSGTIVGNIANGSPIGDMPPALIALGASITLVSVAGLSNTSKRTIPLEDFFIAYGKQDKRPGEFIESVFIPRPKPETKIRIVKLSKRFDSDISAVCGAFAVNVDKHDQITIARIAFGGMAGTPKRASRCEKALVGKPWSLATLDSAAKELVHDYTPLNDVRGSAEYRMTSAQNLLRRWWYEDQPGTESLAETEPSMLAKHWASDSLSNSSSSQLSAKAVPHDSAVMHVTGRAQYIDDIPEPSGTVHLSFGTSKHAHASFRWKDLTVVRNAPGVIAVYTAADIPGDNNVGPIAKDDLLLARDKVEYIGQPMFLVVADSVTAARRAARIECAHYEPLPAVTTIQEARLAGTVIESAQTMLRGDPSLTLEQARHRIRGSIEIGGQEHFYLEGQIALAIPNEYHGLHVLSSTQHPSEVQHLVSHMLGLHSADVTVEVRRMGGGFGGKETQAALFAAAAALAAFKTGKPAKFRCDRDDDMIMTGKRHDFHAQYDVGCDDSGRITALRLELASRCGATMDLSPAINDRAMFHSDNCYFLEHVEIISHRFRTNTVSNTAFRGFGGPQGMLAIERVMDAIALKLQLDPLKVRQANFYSDSRNVTPYYMKVEDFVADKIVDELKAASDFEKRKRKIDAFNQGNSIKKRGIALTPVKFGISFTTTFLNQAGALIHVYTDGSIHLNHGGTEMGQGLNIKVAQIVADVFGVPLEQVRITSTRTDKVPNTSATAASSGTDLNGMASYQAAMTIRQRIADFLAKKYNVDEASVRFGGGTVLVGEHELAFGEACRMAYLGRISLSANGYYSTPKIHYDRATHRGRPFLYFAYGAAVSEVEIDTFTGESRVLRADLLHDVGRSINPAIDLGQVEGGYIQGLGWLTCEEVVYSPGGKLLSYAPSNYKIPCASDRPEMHIELWRSGENREPTIHRSKAVGEPPLMLAISAFSALTYAVAATVEKATVPTLDAPATPERILAAIAKARDQ